MRNRVAALKAAAIPSARCAPWQGRVVTRLSLLWLAAIAPPARAAGLPEIGGDVVGQLDLLGKRIPLPPGGWKVAAAGYGRVTGDEPGPMAPSAASCCCLLPP